MTVKRLDNSGIYKEYSLAPEKCIEGNPIQKIWVEYTDPSECFYVGIWQSEPGKWHVHYTEEEYCHLLEGESDITDAATGAVTKVKAGDRFVIPAGFKGTWEVIETTRKQFVIYENPSS